MTSATANSSPKRLVRLLPYLIVLLIVASYLNTLNSPAVLDDEHSFIFTSRIQLQELTFASLKELADSSFGLPRLIPITTLAINNYFAQGQAPQYHLTNIFIHICTFLATVYFLRQLLMQPSLNHSLRVISPGYFLWAVCGLWALSPVQTNAVTYIVQRMAALCALFYILSLALYLHARRQTSRSKSIVLFGGAALAAIASLLSKENSATLPLALLLLEELFISPGGLEKYATNVIRRHWLLLIITTILLLPVLQSEWYYYANSYGGRSFTLNERLLTESRVVIWYMSLLMLPLPSRMNLDHDFTISHTLFSPITTLLTILLIIALFTLALRVRRRLPLLSFGILFFFLNLLIESTVIPLELIFEHRLYLPSLGFFISLVAVLDYALAWQDKNRLPSNLQKFLYLFLIIILAGCSLLTTQRNNDWRDDLSIYQDMAEKSPRKSRPLSNYGMSLARAGQPEKAIEYLNKAFMAGRPHDEGYYGTVTNLFLAYKRLEGSEKALVKAKDLIKRIPPYADLNYLDRLNHNLAYTYYENKQFDTAIAYIKRAIFLFPTEQNQVSIALCMKIMGDMYDDPALREKHGLKGATKAEAIGEQIVEILIEARDYEKSAKFIAELSPLNPRKAEDLNVVLQNKLDLNKRAAMASDINNDPNFTNNRKFRWSIKAARFIQDHYRPLQPLARWLVNDIAKIFPNDPFVRLMQLQQLLETDPATAHKILKEQLLPEFPDFLPLLNLVIAIEKNTKPDNVYLTARHLLEVYPAAPGWKSIQFFLSTYKPSSTPTENLVTG